ncbi:MAG TPA: hypothetical protein VNQ79_18690 [Blastocatellia bacterium]|nr:hypothetical protein [Blastocatellia bacterium]
MTSSPISSSEPTAFVAGETLVWTKQISGYTPAEGWTLVCYFRGPAGGFDAPGVADASGWRVTVPAAETQNLSAGIYFYQCWVTRADERHLVSSGECRVTASLPAANAPFDGRSETKKILDAIDAMILKKATLDQQEYQIGNRALKRIPLPELIALRDKYARLYAQEQRAERLRQGGTYFKSIFTRFEQSS